jgi:hypothetical protein
VTFELDTRCPVEDDVNRYLTGRSSTAPVTVEFRGENDSTYKAVQTVQAAADGAATATVPVRKPGTFRLRFAGDDTSGRTRTTERFVAVTT